MVIVGLRQSRLKFVEAHRRRSQFNHNKTNRNHISIIILPDKYFMRFYLTMDQP